MKATMANLKEDEELLRIRKVVRVRRDQDRFREVVLDRVEDQGMIMQNFIYTFFKT